MIAFCAIGRDGVPDATGAVRGPCHIYTIPASLCCLLLGYTIPRHGHAGPGAHAIYIPYRHHCAACCLDILYRAMAMPAGRGPCHIYTIPASLCCLLLGYTIPRHGHAGPARGPCHIYTIPASLCCLLLGYTIPRHGHAGPARGPCHIYTIPASLCCLLLGYTIPRHGHAGPGAHAIYIPYRHHCAACCLDILYRAMAMPARPGAHAIYIPYRHHCAACCLDILYRAMAMPARPGAHAIYIPYRHHCIYHTRDTGITLCHPMHMPSVPELLFGLPRGFSRAATADIATMAA